MKLENFSFKGAFFKAIGVAMVALLLGSFGPQLLMNAERMIRTLQSGGHLEKEPGEGPAVPTPGDEIEVSTNGPANPKQERDKPPPSAPPNKDNLKTPPPMNFSSSFIQQAASETECATIGETCEGRSPPCCDSSQCYDPGFGKYKRCIPITTTKDGTIVKNNMECTPTGKVEVDGVRDNEYQCEDHSDGRKGLCQKAAVGAIYFCAFEEPQVARIDKEFPERHSPKCKNAQFAIAAEWTYLNAVSFRGKGKPSECNPMPDPKDKPRAHGLCQTARFAPKNIQEQGIQKKSYCCRGDASDDYPQCAQGWCQNGVFSARHHADAIEALKEYGINDRALQTFMFHRGVCNKVDY